MIMEKDWAWLAGLLEGEGSFLAAHQNSEHRRPQLRVSVKMTDRDVIEHAAKLMNAPSVFSAPDERPNSSECFKCDVNGAKAERVMRMVRPYMGERRGAKIDELLALKNVSHHERLSA